MMSLLCKSTAVTASLGTYVSTGSHPQGVDSPIQLPYDTKEGWVDMHPGLIPPHHVCRGGRNALNHREE